MSEFFDPAKRNVNCKVLDLEKIASTANDKCANIALDPTSLLNNNNNPSYSCLPIKTYAADTEAYTRYTANHQTSFLSNSFVNLQENKPSVSDVKEKSIKEEVAKVITVSTPVDSVSQNCFESRFVASTSTKRTLEAVELASNRQSKIKLNKPFRIRLILKTAALSEVRKLILRNPQALRKIGITTIELGREFYPDKTTSFTPKEIVNLPQLSQSPPPQHPLQIRPHITGHFINPNQRTANNYTAPEPSTSLYKSPEHKAFITRPTYNTSGLVPHQFAMQRSPSSNAGLHMPLQNKSPNHSVARGGYSNGSPHQQPSTVPLENHVGAMNASPSSESPLLANLLSSHPQHTQQQYLAHQMHSPLVHNYGGQVQQQPSTSQDRQHFMSNQHQSIYMPSPQQQSHIQQHGNVLQGVLTSSVSNYVNPNPMQSGPRPTMLSPSNQGVIMGMPVARLPMNQAMSSIPPQNIIISNPHQNLTPPVNDIEPQKTKRKRVTKKQQQKEMEKEQQLRFQHEQQQMMATTHMPQQADFYMQQQRIQSQQVMHPMPGQSIHARMQYQQQRIMQPPFQSAQFQHQAMGYSQHPYGQSAPMASPQYGQNMHGYMQSQQQLWSPHQSQSPHHVGIQFGMGMTHPYKLMTTSNSDFQQKQYVNMKNPVEQNQQSPYPYAVLQQQGYQDQRLNPSSSGAAPFSVYGDAPPVSLPTTPQTPQQSGSVRGSGSFHSHPSTPGSSGTNSAQTRSVQPGSSSTPVQINNSDNIFPHQYSHAGTHVQKHDQLLANLTDYGSGMDDLNVPMSNDVGDFDLDSIEPTMHRTSVHAAEMASGNFQHINQSSYKQPKHFAECEIGMRQSKPVPLMMENMSHAQQGQIRPGIFVKEEFHREAVPQLSQRPGIDSGNVLHGYNNKPVDGNAVAGRKLNDFDFSDDTIDRAESPSKLSEVQQKNVTDCISAVVQQGLEPQLPIKNGKPGPPKGSKKKSNAISQQPTIRPCPQPNLSSGIRITSRTPTPQTPVSTDSAKFNLIPAGLAFNSSLIKHETNDALNRTRTSSMDSLYADRSSVSSHQSSSNSATFNSQQVNGHYNHAGHNNNIFDTTVMTSINDNPGPLPTLKVAKKRKRKLEAPELAEANKYFDSGAIAIGDGEKTVSVVVSNGPGVS